MLAPIPAPNPPRARGFLQDRCSAAWRSGRVIGGEGGSRMAGVAGVVTSRGLGEGCVLREAVRAMPLCRGAGRD